MKAIILAAGVGSRLLPVTEKKPKTLVQVNGTPMLGHILNALRANAVVEICVVAGYQSEQIRDYCEDFHHDLSIEVVENQDFASTNNMYSLWLAREHFPSDGSPCLVMNADLIFDPEIIDLLLKSPHSCFAVDKGRYLEEAMKVVVKDGLIREISKKVEPERAYGCSIDIYKFNPKDLEILKTELDRYIVQENIRTQWTEVLFDNLCQKKMIDIHPCPIGEYRWYEIDNFSDLTEAESLFRSDISHLAGKKLFLFDKDGTLALGNEVLPGAIQFVSFLRSKGIRPMVLTNNSSKTQAEHAASLRKLGFDFVDSDIIVSTEAALRFIRENSYQRAYWVSSEKVGEEIKQHGELTFDDQDPECVLLTYDDTLNYEKITKACSLIREGLPYFATHSDLVCPTPSGPIPDIGASIEVIRMATGRTPDLIFGKPNPQILSHILDELQISDDECVVIGDRLYTDIALAKDNQITSVLVLTGETSRTSYETQDVRADVVTKNLELLMHQMMELY